MARSVLVFVSVTVAVLLIVGCSRSSSVGPPEPSATGLIREAEIDVDGLDRAFDFFIPANLDGHTPALVFLFHGAKSSADYLTGERGRSAPYEVWQDIAESDGIILVYPRGVSAPVGGAGWNDCRLDAATNPVADDVAFVEALIERFVATHNVDRERVYASGTSNGGHMSLRLALELSHKVAAVAPIAAAMPANPCSIPDNPTSVLFINGTDDPLLPYEGGEIAPGEGGRGTVLSASESANIWVGHNGTEVEPIEQELDDLDTRDGSTVLRRTWVNGAEGTEVVLYEIRGGGHLEPSIQERYSFIVERLLGGQNNDIEMATEVWNFFKDKTLN